MNILVSVIIINYNGKKWLKHCLDSVIKQSYRHVEIIFVDNASSDNSVEDVVRNYKDIIICQNKVNVGYAGGCNTGFKKAKGEYLLLLNTDIVLEKDFITKLVGVYTNNKKLAIVQSKIVYLDNPQKIDTCGSFWTSTSLLYHYGNSKDSHNALYNISFPVFSVKGVAVLIKKSVADSIGLFDDDFWCYYEETDFCHRAWLSGYECWYYPDTVVYHAGGGTSLSFDNSFIQFHNFKNKLLSFLKNFSGLSLLIIIPAFLLVNIILSIIWLLQGKITHAQSLYKAIGWNISHLQSTIKKRDEIQKKRTISDQNYFSRIKKDPRLSYYYYLLKIQFEKYTD